MSHPLIPPPGDKRTNEDGPAWFFVGTFLFVVLSVFFVAFTINGCMK